MTNSLLVRTAARWNIRKELAEEVIARDLRGIYCNRYFDPAGPRAGIPSWEHIVNDVSIVTASNIALCCVGCNASKGQKTLEKWLESTYCEQRGITRSSIAPVAAKALRWRQDS